MTAIIEDRDVARLAGAAQRIGSARYDIDEAFLGRAQGSVSRFIFASKETPASAARQLVSAGLVGRDNPMAIALQEQTASRDAAGMMTNSEMLKAASSRATEISKATDDRGVRVSAAALMRRLGQGKMSHQAVAMGFEAITNGAMESGCKDAARKAGEAFAAVTIAGISGRDRERQAAPRRSGREMD